MKKLLFALTLVLCLAISMVAFTSCGGDGEGEGEACEHTWATTATTDKAATCTEEGSASIKCTACGEKKADSVTAIPVIAHDYQLDSRTPATCVADGSETKICSVCADTVVTPIPATGEHRYQANASVDSYPTCTTPGQKSVKCITCQGVKEGSVEVLPAKHEWAMEATIDKAPTETEAGQKSVKCLNCNQPNPDTIVILPALNDTYSYPVDTIEPAEGEIYAFIKDSEYYGSKFAETPGKYYTLIDLSTLEAAYNYVTFTKAAEAAGIYYTFLTEEPVANGYPYYATGYFGLTERRNSKDGVISVHIPEDAAYIYIACSNGEESYLPESIVFSYADFVDPNEAITDGTADFYEYPMDAIVMGEGSIYNTDGVYKSKDSANGYFRVAFIDLTDCAFNTIRMGTSFTSKNVLYTFLTEIPQLGDTISYATGYSGPGMSYPFEDDFVATNYEFTVTIPADAKVLAIYYTDYWYFNGFHDSWGPSYIVLENGEGGESGGNTDPTPDPNPGTPDPDPSVREPLDYLQDATLNEYEYPMDKVVSSGGAIIYWADGENKNKFYINYNNKGDGFYQNAFIEITDTVFNYVTITSNGTKAAGWAFVSEIPEDGEVASYVGTFTTMQKFGWTVDLGASAKIEIPEGAKYLVIYTWENVSYVPASITFTKEEKVTDPDAYSYPVEDVTPINGYINHSGNISNNSHHYLRHAENNERYAFIDLTDLDYNTVTLLGPANGEAAAYTFLTKIPTENSEKISYAINYNDVVWYTLGQGEVTLTIPDNATCLAILYNYKNENMTVVCPQSIVFSNNDKAPSEMLKNDTLDSYEYPMSEIKVSMGTIRGNDSVYIQNFQWAAALVSIDGCAFDKVVFEISQKYGKICYGFLTEYPTLEEVVSFAGGATGTTTVTIAESATVTVDIPDDAVCMVVYWNDWENNAPVYYIPESITFIKDTDAGDEA